jgi:hypothetical protein
MMHQHPNRTHTIANKKQTLQTLALFVHSRKKRRSYGLWLFYQDRIVRDDVLSVTITR